MNRRKSSEIRIKTGTFLSGNKNSVFLSSNFALSTAIKHDFILKDRFLHTSKYFLGSLSLSLIYFTLHEEITYQLSKISVRNYFASYSLTSLALFPFFTIFQRSFLNQSWNSSRFLSYRYLGTICCFSLVGELIIQIYRHSSLDNIDLEILNIFRSKSTKEFLAKTSSEFKDPSQIKDS
jgi:hypothetical protein